MNENVLEEMAKHQFILGVKIFISRERFIVKRPETLKNAIEFAQLSEVDKKPAREKFPYSNKNNFVGMPFRNSGNAHTRNNFESSGFNNFSRNNCFEQKHVNKYF